MQKSDSLFFVLFPLAVYFVIFSVLAFNELFTFSILEKSDERMAVFNFVKSEAGIGFLSPEEVEHMKEVRFYLHLIFYLALILLFLVLTFKAKLEVIVKSSAIGFVIPIILFFVDFDFIFRKAHWIFKTQWLFPSDYLLVNLFPRQFFYDFFTGFIAVSVIVNMLICLFCVLKLYSLKQ